MGETLPLPKRVQSGDWQAASALAQQRQALVQQQQQQLAVGWQAPGGWPPPQVPQHVAGWQQ